MNIMLKLVNAVLLLAVSHVAAAVAAATHASACVSPIVAGQVNIVVDGEVQTWSVISKDLAGVPVSSNNNNITVKHNTRAYIVPGCPLAFKPDTFATRLPLLGRVLNYTVDLSTVGCACNAAFYSVFMPAYDSNNQPDATNCGDYYCDANKVCGVYCPEMDIMEANTAAFQVTPHACDSPQGLFYPSCDGGGCGLNTRAQSNAYGPGSSFQIDTTQPFVVSTAFYMDEQTQQLTRVLTTLSQPRRQPVLIDNRDSDCRQPGYLEQLTHALAAGMVPTLSVWGDSASTMSWLDVPPCSTSQNCDPSAVMSISNLSLNVL